MTTKFLRPPKSVFDYVRNSGETRITWQPKMGVRSATVIARFNGANPGFVLIGRSMKEVEIREDNALKIVLIGWIVTILASFAAVLFALKLTSKT